VVVEQLASSPQHAAPRAQLKRVKKAMKAWREAFAATHGRKSTSDDIAADADIAALYDEYLALKHADDASAASPAASPIEMSPDLRAVAVFDGDDEASPALAMDDGSPARSADPANVKRRLNRVLAAWRGSFHDTNGRAPDDDDISANPQISGVYDQYLAAQTAVGVEGAETETASPAVVMETEPELPQPSSPTSADPAKAKRRLNKVLRKWREEFTEEHGRKPTQSDLQRDADIAPAYAKYAAFKAEADALSPH
jgi:hypothetical protein